MNISTYLKHKNMSANQLAIKSGVPQPTVSRILNGKSRPSPETAQKIEQATGGAVTLRELLFPEKPAA